MLFNDLVSTASVQETLFRSIEGKSISKIEAYEIFRSCEDKLIISCARKIRNNISTNSKVVTYSRKIFVNLTNLCRDSCSYCTYKKDPDSQAARMMKPSEVIALAEVGKRFRCTEALIVTGERPEQKYIQARDWLKSLGHSSTVEYVAEISEEVLKKTGLLPHTNAGSLTKKEMSLLKRNNASLGMMLETTSQRLTEDNMPHNHAPSKNSEEIIDSLFAIKEVNKKYGHIQEVILQNFMPKPGTPMESTSSIGLNQFLKIVALARIILQDINIQVPPNLNPGVFGSFLDAGINDWGGISPVTIDYVNPEFPWPTIEAVKSVTLKKGYTLRARLPIYPEFILKSNSGYVSDAIKVHSEQFSDSAGLVREDLVN